LKHGVAAGLRVEVVGSGADHGYGIIGEMRSAPTPESTITSFIKPPSSFIKMKISFIKMKQQNSKCGRD
jgi:hypothetical protein